MWMGWVYCGSEEESRLEHMQRSFLQTTHLKAINTLATSINLFYNCIAIDSITLLHSWLFCCFRHRSDSTLLLTLSALFILSLPSLTIRYSSSEGENNAYGRSDHGEGRSIQAFRKGSSRKLYCIGGEHTVWRGRGESHRLCTCVKRQESTWHTLQGEEEITHSSPSVSVNAREKRFLISCRKEISTGMKLCFFMDAGKGSSNHLRKSLTSFFTFCLCFNRPVDSY